MNKQRRKQIENLAGQLGAIRSELETLRDEEQEAYDNMPESLQAGEKGEAVQGFADSLDEAVSSLEEIESNLNDICSA